MHAPLIAPRGFPAVLQDVGDGIRAQPGRTVLAFFAIAVGLAALVVLIAVLSGLKQRSRQIVQELGTNVVAIFPQKRAKPVPERELRIDHAALLAANLKGCRVSTLRLEKAPTLGTRDLVTVAATDESLATVRQWQIEQGRFLDAADVAGRERNAVVSAALSRLWGWKVGSLVVLGDLPFRVVGIVSPGGNPLELDLADSRLALGERVVLVPRSVAPYWLTEQEHDGRRVDAIFVKYPFGVPSSAVLALVERLLSAPDNASDAYSFVTAESMMRRLDELRSVVALSVGGIVALCLLLGGTTLMSLMIANVHERIGEIGLRRALGASSAEIALLFVLEGCAVTACAAALGVLAAHGLILAFKNVLPISVTTGSATLVWPPLLAVAMGMAFSYWPARLAASIAPSEALRNA